MKNFLKVVTLAVVMASSSLVSAAQEAQKMAVVFPSKIMQQSLQQEKINKKLNAEFAGRIKELKELEKEVFKIESDLQKNSGMMEDSKKISLKREHEALMADLKLKAKAFNEDKRSRLNDEQQKSWTTIHDVIKSVATKNGYDVVLNGEQILFAAPELDISDIVINELSKK